jgi:RHS repeat-associated protein
VYHCGVVQWYVVTASPTAPSATQLTAEMGQPLLQFDGNLNLTERNLVAINPGGNMAVMAQEAVSSLSQGGPVTWTADDNLGTSRDLVNNNGVPINHTVYTSFGQIAYQSNPTVTFWAGFGGGHISLATGLIDDDLRWVDTDTGRWLSTDPLGFGGHDTNLSRYVGNNPTNANDPSGEITQAQAAAMLVTPVFLWPLILLEQAQQQAAQEQQQHQQDMAAIQALMKQVFAAPHVLPQGAAAQAAAWGGQIGPPNWVDSALAPTTNFFAGYANVVTAGYYNQWIGGNAAFVDTNSWWYTGGQAAGWMWWAAMGSTLAWNAAGAPTYGVGIGPSSQQPFHVLFGPANGAGPTTWYHAVGTTGEMWITQAGSQATGSMWGSLTGIPILSPSAVGTAPGAYNCISAAGWGFVQGWLPFL